MYFHGLKYDGKRIEDLFVSKYVRVIHGTSPPNHATGVNGATAPRHAATVSV